MFESLYPLWDDLMLVGDQFQLLRPEWLWGLLLLVAGNIWLRVRRHQSRSWASYCEPELLPYLLTEVATEQRQWPRRLLNLVALLALLALAGPSWERIPQPLLQDQSAMVVLLDLSSSMDATDVAPSRLTRARLKLHDLLQRRRDGQTGLVVFAGSAFVVTPLTSDIATITALLGSLDTSMMPRQGSHPETALQSAIELLQQAGQRHGDLLLITDGVSEGCGQRCSGAAAAVEAAGYRLSVIAVGSEAGAPIPLRQGGFLKDRDGNIVVPRLQPEPLQQLADLGGGVFTPLRVDDADIEMVLALGLGRPEVDQLAQTQQQQQQWREEGPWLVLLLLPLVAAFYRRGLWVVPLLLLMQLPAPAEALEWGELWQRPAQRGAELFAQGEYQQALPLLDSPEWQAAAAFRAGDYQQAAELLAAIDAPEAHYNRGNALAKQQDLAGALHAYQQALELNPQHRDAAYNLEQVQTALEQQQDQSEEQQQQDQQPSSSGDEAGDEGEQGEQGSNDPQQGEQQQGDQSSGSSSSDGSGDPEPGAQANSAEQGGSGESQPDAGSTATPEDEPTTAEEAGATQQQEHLSEADAEPEQAAAPQQQEQGGEAADKGKAQMSSSDQRPEVDADAQWLRRIPDDPGGLLRRKFKYQYQQQANSQGEVKEAW